MGKGEEGESKGQQGNIFPPPSLLPAFLFSRCEGQAWRGCGLAQWLCMAPCGASHRNPINHRSRSLTPGHKDPTRWLHSILHMQTHTHTQILAYPCSAREEKETRRVSEVQVIISKMFLAVFSREKRQRNAKYFGVTPREQSWIGLAFSHGVRICSYNTAQFWYLRH